MTFHTYAAQCAIELLRGLSSVKSLELYNNILESLHHTKDTLHLLPTFYNLTDLYVGSVSQENTSAMLMDILRKTPKLDDLTIPGVVLNYLDGEDLMLNSVPCCFKSSLSRLCILNFYGTEYEIQYVTFIIENAPYLGEIKIHCSRHLSADTEKMNDVWNQLEDLCLEGCVIKFCYNYYDPFDDESDED